MISPQVIAYKPMNPPKKINTNLYIIMDSVNGGTANSAIAVAATIITIGADTIPASTAA